MATLAQRKTIVIGHKNPDTDSICSAIAYARLKHLLTGQNYEPRRAGQVNQETQFVLDRFGVEAPEYIQDVGTQVKDIEIRETKGVNSTISLKKAWSNMKDNNVVTLPIVKNHVDVYKRQVQSMITASSTVPLMSFASRLDSQPPSNAYRKLRGPQNR